MLLSLMLVPQGTWALGGSGTSSSPYTISSAADLLKFANIVNGANGETKNISACGKLTADITLSGTWKPIGNSSGHYKGTFDGQGHKISGLSLTATAANAGLFGYVEDATIQNFTLAGSISSGYDNTGSVVGSADGATKIYNVYSSVNITMTAAKSHIGGIAGQLLQENSKVPEIKGCTYSGTMNLGSSTDSNGGIVGYCEKDANVQIEYCFFHGSISSSGSTPRIGGILGYADDENSQNFNYIRNCYCDGTLSPSSGTYVGAIAGYPRGNVPGVITNNTYKSGMATNALGNGKKSYTSEAIEIDLHVPTYEDHDCGKITQSYINPTSTTPTQLKVVLTTNYGFIFDSWSKGSTDMERILPLTSSIIEGARFNVRDFTVEVFTNNVNYGGVTINSDRYYEEYRRVTYKYLTPIILVARANSGYHFKEWSDGSTDWVHSVTVTGSAAYTATFIPHPYSEWTVDNKATCSDNGTMSRVCTYEGCTAKETKIIPRSGHAYQPDKDAEGKDNWIWTDYSIAKLRCVCTTCGRSTTLEVSGTDIVKTIVTAPTCTKEGECLYTATGTLEGKTYQSTKTETLAPQHQWENFKCKVCGIETPSVTGISGTCKWTSYDSGELIIEPLNGISGELEYWEGYSKPWDSRVQYIKDVKFKGEVIAQNCGGMFQRCSLLQSIDLTGLNTDKVKVMSSMFAGCSSLQTLDLSCLNTENVTAMGYMFMSCSSLKSLDLSTLNMKSMKYYVGMFTYCYNLGSLTLNNDFVVDFDSNLREMFYRCGGHVAGGCAIHGVTDVYLRDKLMIGTAFNEQSFGFRYYADDFVTIRDGKSMRITQEVEYPLNKVVFDRRFTKDKPATLVLPFSTTGLIPGVQLYKFKDVKRNGDGEWVATLVNTSDVEAYKPYVVVPLKTNLDFAGNQQPATFPVTPDQSTMTMTDPDTGWTLVGLSEPKSWETGDSEIGKAYGFAGKDKNVAGNDIHRGDFVKIAAGASAKPGRCYLVKEGDLVSNAKGMTRVAAAEELPSTIKVRFINGEATGIAELNTETGEMSDIKWYDLNGRRIENPAKGGIYIKNNKKLLVK